MLKRLLTVEEYNILETLMEEFLQKTYEYINQAEKPIPGLVNFFLNKKSRNVDPDDTSTVNRSYSIGGTIIKGEGKEYSLQLYRYQQVICMKYRNGCWSLSTCFTR